MATVVFPKGLQTTTGTERIEVECGDVRELIAALDRRFPGLGAQLRSGVAIAIDGEIHQDPLYEPLEPDSEVHFLPSISGGR